MHSRTITKMACAAGMLALALAGCASPGPVLVRNILYQAPTATAAAQTKKVVAGVSPLADARGAANSVLGNRTISGDIRNDLVVQGTVADLVTAALKDALTARGITVKDMPAWDVEAGPGAQAGADLLFGGEIKAFWVDVQSRPLNVQTKATVQLRVAVADAAEGKVLRTLNLNSALSREDIAFSFDTVERTLSEALSAALDQLLTDEIIRERLQ
jgi:hypothetical protein